MIAIRWSRFAHVISNSTLELRIRSCLTCNTDRQDPPFQTWFPPTFLLTRHSLARDCISSTTCPVLWVTDAGAIKCSQGGWLFQINDPKDCNIYFIVCVFLLNFLIQYATSYQDQVNRNRTTKDCGILSFSQCKNVAVTDCTKTSEWEEGIRVIYYSSGLLREEFWSLQHPVATSALKPGYSN